MKSINDILNNFLYFDEDDGEVKITKQAEQLDAVKELKKKDRTGNNSYFKKCLTFTYHMFHKDSVFAGSAYERKISIIKSQYGLENFDERDLKLKEFIKTFREFHYTPSEIRYIRALDDIDQVLDRLSLIPVYIEKEFEFKVKLPTAEKDKDGNFIEAYKIKRRVVTIDNSEEKAKALKNIDSLIKLQERLEPKMKGEAKTASVIRLFDQ